jgi:SNARE protein
MSDLGYLEKEINQLIDTCIKELKDPKKKDPSQKLKLINRSQTKMQEIKTKIEDFELGILGLDKKAQIPHGETLKKLQKRFRELKSEINAKKNEVKPDAKEGTLGEGLLKKNFEDMQDVELIKIGDETQQKGKQAVGRILQDLNAANERADAANLELARQDEVIAEATAKAKDVQSQTKLAMQQVKYFAKQVYTDKILMCLIFLCAAACIAIIVLKVKSGAPIIATRDVIKTTTK